MSMEESWIIVKLWNLSHMPVCAGREAAVSCAWVCLKNSSNKLGPSSMQMFMPNLYIVTCGLFKISHLPEGDFWQNIRPKITSQLWTRYLLSWKSSQTKLVILSTMVLFLWEILYFLHCVFNGPFPTYTERVLQTHCMVSVFITPFLYNKQSLLLFIIIPIKFM